MAALLPEPNRLMACSLPDDTPLAALLPKPKRKRAPKQEGVSDILTASKDDSVFDRIRRSSRFQQKNVMSDAATLYPSDLLLPNWADLIVDYISVSLGHTPPIDVVINTWSDCVGPPASECRLRPGAAQSP